MRTKHRLIGGGRVRCDDGCSADFAASALRADAARCDARPGSPAPGSAGGNGRTPYVRFPAPARSCVRLSVRLSENVGFHPYVFLLRRGPGEFGAGRLGGNVRRRREAGYVPLSCSGSRRSGAVRAAPAAEIRPRRGRAALVEAPFFHSDGDRRIHRVSGFACAMRAVRRRPDATDRVTPERRRYVPPPASNRRGAGKP